MILWIPIILVVCVIIYVLKIHRFDVTIVSSHFREDLDWLKESRCPVIICDKAGSDPMNFEPDPSCFLEVNRGRESASYLKYIIENYDSLPEYMAFIHGHESSWHQEPNLLKLIYKSKIHKYDYISLDRTLVVQNEIGYELYKYINERWDALFGLVFKIDRPEKITYIAGGQFIVSRRAVLKHTKEEYQMLFDFVIDPDLDDYRTGYSMEVTWHILFGCDPDISKEFVGRDYRRTYFWIF